MGRCNTLNLLHSPLSMSIYLILIHNGASSESAFSLNIRCTASQVYLLTNMYTHKTRSTSTASFQLPRRARLHRSTYVPTSVDLKVEENSLQQYWPFIADKSPFTLSLSIGQILRMITSTGESCSLPHIILDELMSVTFCAPRDG